jgi:hypothetical protein
MLCAPGRSRRRRQMSGRRPGSRRSTQRTAIESPLRFDAARLLSMRSGSVIKTLLGE